MDHQKPVPEAQENVQAEPVTAAETVEPQQIDPALQYVDRDINIILLLTGVVLGLNIWLQPARYLQNPDNALTLRTAAMLGLQFGLMGLGALLVVILRKESPAKYGLRMKGLGKSILFSLVAAIPMLIYYAWRGVRGYMPTSNIMTMPEWIAKGFPQALIGIIPTLLVWGLIQAFSYGVVADKLSISDPVEQPWLQMGPIYCSVFYLVLHGFGFSMARLPELIATLLTVWGLHHARRLSGNTWGMVLMYGFLFNAFILK